MSPALGLAILIALCAVAFGLIQLAANHLERTHSRLSEQDRQHCGEGDGAIGQFHGQRDAAISEQHHAGR